MQRARKFRDELDDPRQLVDCDVLAAAVDDLLLQLLAARVAGFQEDESLDVLPADGVEQPLLLHEDGLRDHAVDTPSNIHHLSHAAVSHHGG